MSRIIFQREEPPKKPKKSTKRKTLRDHANKEWRPAQPTICPVCCKEPATEEHHILEKGMGGSLACECDENRLLICKSCHDLYHRELIPLACILRAKKDVSGIDLVKLRQIAGHRFVPDLIVCNEQSGE